MKIFKCLVITLCWAASCHSQEMLVNYETPATILTDYDSIIELNKSQLMLPDHCMNGKSYVKLIIDINGFAKDFKVVRRTNGCTEMDSIAIAVAKQFKFSPTKYKKEPVEVIKVLPIPFFKEE